MCFWGGSGAANIPPHFCLSLCSLLEQIRLPYSKWKGTFIALIRGMKAWFGTRGGLWKQRFLHMYSMDCPEVNIRGGVQSGNMASGWIHCWQSGNFWSELMHIVQGNWCLESMHFSQSGDLSREFMHVEQFGKACRWFAHSEHSGNLCLESMHSLQVGNMSLELLHAESYSSLNPSPVTSQLE